MAPCPALYPLGTEPLSEEDGDVQSSMGGGERPVGDPKSSRLDVGYLIP